MKPWSTCLLLTVCSASGCVSEDEIDTADVTVADDKADASAQIAVTAGATRTITFTAPSFPIELSVDCAPSPNPDIVGTTFTVTSAALGMSTPSPVYAASWSWSGEAEPGPSSVEITGVSGSSACTVRLRRVADACATSLAFRSPETGHNHLPVGTTVSNWGEFPAAGNHWGAWAPWNSVYTRPVKRGFYLHNLEHGGLVLSYACSAPDDSEECAEAAANLETLTAAFGAERVIVTPDPDQPSLYGVRGWRNAYQSDCYSEDRMLAFMAASFRLGREDVDADPPLPYDPTTTNVPCQNLFGAPDSCP